MKVGTDVPVAVGSGEGVEVKVGRGVGVLEADIVSFVDATAAAVDALVSVVSGGVFVPQAVNPNKLMA